MTDIEFAEQVVAVVHARTLSGKLAWEVKASDARAELTKDLVVRLRFTTTGPDTAKWKEIVVHGPGDAIVIIGDRDSLQDKYSSPAPEAMLVLLDQVFEQVYLEPRRLVVANALAAMHALK